MIMYILLTGKHPLYSQGDSFDVYEKKLKESTCPMPNEFSE